MKSATPMILLSVPYCSPNETDFRPESGAGSRSRAPPNVEGASVDHRVCGPRSPALHVVEQSIWRITPYPRLGLVVTTLRAAKAVWRLHFRMVTGCGL